ncbi:cysteine-rich and transmembrane domain-containing protein 1-like [Acipenser oxyrinchus oxyrinchus]|uniref:Cysteine-rich and transmembrane domain-containing protein 1 n=1 Tax=Acipenser oxyrinchus oxyrinchus TaxID=40147 RepID=A0AAD8D0N9_ACIOX|nr:cysteine-rich and transmembrane domain-containing protein 1-like [Acipenser oxyrinchus oxyrinchus]
MNYENPPPYSGPGPSAPGYPPYTQQPNPAYPGPNPAYPGPGVNQAYPNYPPGSGAPTRVPILARRPYAGPGQPGYPGYPQYAPPPGQVYGDAPKNTVYVVEERRRDDSGDSTCLTACWTALCCCCLWDMLT